jgi:quercetin dioxygenase-like cupin family protein
MRLRMAVGGMARAEGAQLWQLHEVNTMEALKDASHLYEVERRERHLERPGFRIQELQLSSTQKVPWHYHNKVSDTFYVLTGTLRIFLQDPKEEIRLAPGESFTAKAGRPHLVTNGGNASVNFLVLQGVGEYDYVPLLAPDRAA